MKRVIFSLLLFSNLFADAQNADSVATAPTFSGTCSDLAKFALTQKPVLASQDYYIGSAVDLSQDMKIAWQVNQAGSFDGAGATTKVVTNANCLRPETLETQVASKVDYYRTQIANKTNPLINQITNDSKAVASNQSTSSKYTDEFTLKPSADKSVGFFTGFLDEIKEPYAEVQTYIVLFFLFISLLSLGGDWIFFNVGKMAKENVGKTSSVEVLHRLFIAIPILLIFYTSSGSTTRAQDIFAGWVSMGSNLADSLANKTHVANAKYTIREISTKGGFTSNELEKKVRGIMILDELAKVNQAILSSCMQTYDIASIKASRESSQTDLIFPASATSMGSTQADFDQRFVLKKMQQSENPSSTTTYFSVSTCSAAETVYRSYLQQKPKLEAYFTKLLALDAEKIKYTVAASMNKNITMGWTSIALLPAQQAMQSQTSAIDAQLDKSAFDNVEFDFSAQGFEKLYDTYTNFSFSKSIESLTQRTAFLFVPGASGVYSTYKEVFGGLVTAGAAPAEVALAAEQKGADAASKGLSSIPVVGGILSAMFGVLSGVIGGGLMKFIAVGKTVLSTIPPFYIATEAAKIMIESLVYIIPVLVTGVVVAWWYVEVFAYIIMVPFAAAYAFGENARANILQFIIKGIGLAFKPMLIVLSVFLAVKGAAMFEFITNGMISIQDITMMAQANTVLSSTEWNMSSPLAGWGGWLASAMKAGMIEGILFIAVAILKTFFIASVILKLPSFMLELFSIKADSNGHDSIVSKIGTVTKGI